MVAVKEKATSGQLSIRRGMVPAATSSEDAIAMLREQVHQPDALATIVFASPAFDLDTLGPGLAKAFPGGVFGCSTSGEIGPQGYGDQTISAVSLASDVTRLHDWYIDDVRNVSAAALAEMAAATQSAMEAGRSTFAMLLINGMSMAEEHFAAAIHAAVQPSPVFGGSAGDDLAFQETFVLSNGQFRTGAVVLLFETELPFEVFKLEHYRPTEVDLVITGAVPEERRVTEINGTTALEGYAEALGVSPEEVNADLFAVRPLTLQLGGGTYIRSIQKVHDDGSMTFFCAIDEGLVLRVGGGTDMVSHLEAGLAEVCSRLDSPQLVVAFECVLRRAEAHNTDVVREMGEIYQRHGAVGFHTYGEVFGSVHINQTLTGLVLGE